MIPRYQRKEISKIWEPENKFDIWLKIEILICEALAEKGKIPNKSLQIIKKNAKFETSRIEQIEKEVKHDVIAFLTNVAENVGEDSRFIHKGVTSSDIIDTSLVLMCKESLSVIENYCSVALFNMNSEGWQTLHEEPKKILTKIITGALNNSRINVSKIITSTCNNLVS